MKVKFLKKVILDSNMVLIFLKQPVQHMCTINAKKRGVLLVTLRRGGEWWLFILQFGRFCMKRS